MRRPSPFCRLLPIASCTLLAVAAGCVRYEDGANYPVLRGLIGRRCVVDRPSSSFHLAKSHLLPEFVWTRRQESAITLPTQTVLRVDHLEGFDSDSGDHGVVVQAVVEEGALAGTHVVLGQALRHGKRIVIEPSNPAAADLAGSAVSLRPLEPGDRKFFPEFSSPPGR